jgi:multimeric flavodoxin WrbA
MKKIVAFNGSPRKTGNTQAMLSSFLEGTLIHIPDVKVYNTHEIQLEYCRGCLRCNILGKCSINGDDWGKLSAEIIDADILVFASPVYFHHVTASMKKLIDRFRSFIHVQITETGLIHTPRHEWKKEFVLLLSMGSSDNSDARPIIELFQFMTSILGNSINLHILEATRVAVVQQINKTAVELETLYAKLSIPPHLATGDSKKNSGILKQCSSLGNKLSIS